LSACSSKTIRYFGEATAALSFEEIEAEFGRHAARKQQRP